MTQTGLAARSVRYALLRLSCKEQPVAICECSGDGCRFVVVTEACRATFSAEPTDLVGAPLEEYLLSDLDRTELQQVKSSAPTASHSCLVKSRCGAFVWAEKLDAIPNQFLDKCLQRVHNALAIQQSGSCNSLERSNSDELVVPKPPAKPQHIRNDSGHVVSMDSLDALYWRDAPRRKTPGVAHGVLDHQNAEYSFADVFEDDYTSTESSPATDIYPRKHPSGVVHADAHSKPALPMLTMPRKESNPQLAEGDWGWFFDMGSPA
jgi:hypothetical protein